ncbi:MAG TPA: ABC transporter ATP-binding protein [Bacteroidota bacterium]|nr:ABC transporter ATP-binding protein [Bacteroidota bacterium]
MNTPHDMDTPHDIAVEARELSKVFGAFRAVDSISLQVRRGEIFGFLGANGAGKTTAIRMFCGLLPPSGGSARVAGFDVATQARAIKQNIGYMSQKFSLYEDLTVAENIEFYGGVYGLSRDDIRSTTARLLDELQLGHQRDTLTRALPLGWKQRLALSASLMHRPSIIFLDEPTGGVDPISRRNFWRVIHDLAAAGTTVFVTTHYMDEAEYCERISIMYQGRIIDMGSPSELKRRHGKRSMQDVFVHLVNEPAAAQAMAPQALAAQGTGGAA